MAIFYIEELSNRVHPTISYSYCSVLAEYCIVALENNFHKSGCKLKVEGDIQHEFELIWGKQVSKGGYQEPKEITEKAAEAISFFLVSECTDYNIVLQAKIGTGVDYWLCYHEQHELYDPLNFMQARIEISGINTESGTNNVKSRNEIKKRQTCLSDKINLPAYVSIIEMATPKALFSKK